MRSGLAAAAALFLTGTAAAPAAAQVTYSFTGPAAGPGHIQNQIACTPPAVCAAYVVGDQITLSFAVAAPLAANLANADISTLVTSYSAADGVQTLVDTDAQVRLHDFRVTTNAAGEITSANIDLYRWRGAAAAGAFIDNIFITANVPEAYVNGECSAVIPGLAAASPADSCSGGAYTSSRSRMTGFGPTGGWATTVGVPAVTALAPATGATTGGTVVTITGGNFVGVSGVTFGGVPATSYSVDSFTSISAVAPGGAAGVVDVTVTTASGPSANTAADNFTYVTPPVTIPTMTEWAMILFGLLLAGGAAVRLARPARA